MKTPGKLVHWPGRVWDYQEPGELHEHKNRPELHPDYRILTARALSWVVLSATAQLTAYCRCSARTQKQPWRTEKTLLYPGVNVQGNFGRWHVSGSLLVSGETSALLSGCEFGGWGWRPSAGFTVPAGPADWERCQLWYPVETGTQTVFTKVKGLL